jgi:hypothetical protein
MDVVKESARQFAGMIERVREHGELDYFYAYLVDEYPDECEELAKELLFWFSEN